jgi:hypothetical protein
MENQNQTVYPPVYRLEIVGNLGHDNAYFDKTCSNCGGMYFSGQYATCPKCGGTLTAITTKEGKPMSISEGTLYPAFGEKQKKRNAQAIANRKNGMESVYRFKIFSFADANGYVSPPAEQHLLKKGARVKVFIRNHPVVASWFLSKENKPKVELMMQIYPQYGDTIQVLKEAQVAAATQGVTMGPNGQPAPLDTSKETNEIAQLEARIAYLRGQQGKPAAPPAAPSAPPAPFAQAVTQPEGMDVHEAAALADDTPPWVDGQESAFTGEVDPFDNF